jgi:hypothetical protein
VRIACWVAFGSVHRLRWGDWILDDFAMKPLKVHVHSMINRLQTFYSVTLIFVLASIGRTPIVTSDLSPGRSRAEQLNTCGARARTFQGWKTPEIARCCGS